RSDTFDRARVDVADGEDPGAAGLKEQRSLAIERITVFGLKVAAGEEKPGAVGRQLTLEPLGVRQGADEDEQRAGPRFGAFARPAELPPPTITTGSPARSCASAWVAA